jgi:methylase of polypeptide subunit release factors
MSDEFAIAGLRFLIAEGVATITAGSRLLASVCEVKPGERVLDLGTGGGVQAVLAAGRGAMVVATDVQTRCLDCARANANRHGVAHAIDFRLGSLFEPVAVETFDLIVTVPPQMPPLDRAAPNLGDEAIAQGREVLDGILTEAHSHLRPCGRLLLGQFAFHGVARSLACLRECGLDAQVVAEQTARSLRGAERLHLLQSLGLTEGVSVRDDEVWLTRVVIAARKT